MCHCPPGSDNVAQAGTANGGWWRGWCDERAALIAVTETAQFCSSKVLTVWLAGGQGLGAGRVAAAGTGARDGYRTIATMWGVEKGMLDKPVITARSGERQVGPNSTT